MFKLSNWTLSLTTTALFASTSWLVFAQGGPEAASTRPDPADAAVLVAPFVYQSSFAGYRGIAAQEVENWRESNDNVGRIGGWRAYAQESRPSKPVAKSPATPPKPGAASKPPPAAKSPLVPAIKNPPGNPAPADSGAADDAHQHH